MINMVFYKFKKSPLGSHFIPENDVINVDLFELGKITDKDRDIMIPIILTHEHIHRLLDNNIGKVTSILYDSIFHKYEYNYKEFERISKVSKLLLWKDYPNHINFRVCRPFIKTEHKRYLLYPSLYFRLKRYLKRKLRS